VSLVFAIIMIMIIIIIMIIKFRVKFNVFKVKLKFKLILKYQSQVNYPKGKARPLPITTPGVVIHRSDSYCHLI